MARESGSTRDSDIKALVNELGGANRRRRQDASHALALLAQEDTSALLDHLDVLLDALYRPEAQTRWEILSALGEVAVIDADSVSDAYESAEASLFDEDSAIVRLAAFRFLVRLGESSPERSDMVWPVLNEAVQCYHGDPEYRDMLVALTEFARGDISEQTRDALVARVSFDAKNGHGYIKAYSSEIMQVVGASN